MEIKELFLKEIERVPESYPEDAHPIAIAVINEMDFLLSWNFKHVVRKKTRDIVKMVNTLHPISQNRK